MLRLNCLLSATTGALLFYCLAFPPVANAQTLAATAGSNELDEGTSSVMQSVLKPESESVVSPCSALAMQNPVKVCPWYPIVEWGSYTTYYAETCFGTYGPMNGPNGLQVSSCTEDGPNDCKLGGIDMFAAGSSSGLTFAVAKDLAVEGLTGFAGDPKWGAGVEPVGAPKYVNFTKPGNGPPRKVTVKLYLLKVTGAETDEYIGVGQEVPFMEQASFVTSVERFRRNCFNVRLGTVTHQVITVGDQYRENAVSAVASALK